MDEGRDVAALRIVEEVLELEGADRTARLRQACSADVALLHRVESLLAAVEKDDNFLKGPTISDAPAYAANTVVEGPGTRIGPYKLLELIGQGGFGSVFMAEQSTPVRRRVALKIIKLGMDTRQTLARFEAERQALALMDHPNIAKVFDAGATDTGRPYFVMELVRGEAVTSYCDREELSLSDRLTLFRDICLAVQHAHQKGIIHRDLKPTNVLVTVSDARPIPKVIDFGIAKATASPLTDKTLFTEFRQLLGTPEYMSPEQAEPVSTDIDTRSDIYSLGALLYELLTGTTPFDAHKLIASGYDEMRRILRDEEPQRPSLRLQTLVAAPPEVSKGYQGSSAQVRILTPDAAMEPPRASSAIDIARRRRLDLLPLTRALRGDLDWIVLKCLDKDRSRRYQTAIALAEDIGCYLAHEPVVATPPSAGYRLRKFARRNRAVVLTGAVVSATLIIAAGVSIRFGLSEARQRRAAGRSLARAEKAEADAKSRASELEQVARFQQGQLSGINARNMGVRLRADLLEEARAAAERSKLPPDQVNARIGELEKLIAGTDFTGMALGTLDQNFFKPAQETIEKQFAGQPLVKARLLQSLASTERDLGLLDAATRSQEESLAIRRSTLGYDHPDTLESTKEMGYLLWAQGRFKEAEPFLREAMDKRRHVLGLDHDETLDSIDKYGGLLRDQGRLLEAESYIKEALEGRRRVFGDNNPATCASMANLATLLTAQGKLAEAEPYDREALERYCKELGEDHPHTLIAINNMAVMLQGLGKLAEAEAFYRESLERSTRVLGHDHPDTLTLVGNFGVLLKDRGKLAEAEGYSRDAVDSRRRVLGDDHPYTLNSISSLGVLLNELGRYSEAERFTREALETRRRVLGAEHSDTLTSMGNLSLLLQNQGKLDEAEAMCREALAIRRRVLGDEHPLTLNSINNLGVLLKSEGKLAEAEGYSREALEIRRRKLGDEHRETLTSMLNLATLLKAEDKLAEAEPLSREALEGCRRVLGDKHALTLISIGNMGSVLHAQGKSQEAVELLAAAEPEARRSFTGGNILRLERWLLALGRARIGIGAFDAALTNLTEAEGMLKDAKGTTPQDRKDLMRGIVELYIARHAAEPGKGYDVEAADWRARLQEYQASTQPAAAAGS